LFLHCENTRICILCNWWRRNITKWAVILLFTTSSVSDPTMHFITFWPMSKWLTDIIFFKRKIKYSYKFIFTFFNVCSYIVLYNTSLSNIFLIFFKFIGLIVINHRLNFLNLVFSNFLNVVPNLYFLCIYHFLYLNTSRSEKWTFFQTFGVPKIFHFLK